MMTDWEMLLTVGQHAAARARRLVEQEEFGEQPRPLSRPRQVRDFDG
jgi:hypothetical protein